jgi:7-keto-8-aminopelargonate synthetase-like enzyme
MKGSGTSFAPAHTANAADRSMAEAVAAGVVMQSIDAVAHSGRYLELHGRPLMNFGSCSYLGLDQRPELKRGAIDAIERFGTQFSFSRAYLQLPLYDELESALSSITGGFALVTPSTTLGHIAALPVLVESGDAVIVDQFAHASLHTALALLRVPVHPARHNRMDQLEEKIANLAKTHRRVWFVLDGLYSMLGDFAPVDRIAALLAKYEQLHAYIDDAHGMSWTGKNGRGYALDRLRDTRRVVVAVSLSKAFAAGGGALVFSDDEDRLRVRRCGGPMVFSGPLQPAVLGAGLASATLHLRPDFTGLQEGLGHRIERILTRSQELSIPLATLDRTPIFFVRCGPTNLAYSLVHALRDRGIYVCPSAFPAVPINQAGIRFTVSLSNALEDVDYLVDTLAAETKRLAVPGLGQRSSASETRRRVSERPSQRVTHRSSFPPPSH